MSPASLIMRRYRYARPLTRRLTPRQRSVARAVANHPYANYAELGELLGINHQSVWVTILSLEHRGVLSRQPTKWKLHIPKSELYDDEVSQNEKIMPAER